MPKFFQPFYDAADQIGESLAPYYRERYKELEDEIDNLAADGSPAAKLRIERLSQRLKRERDV